MIKDRKMADVKKVIFVHGAWADELCWNKVRVMLDAAGIPNLAVRLPLTTLADDAAIVQQAIAAVAGPVLLVGHSYGRRHHTSGQRCQCSRPRLYQCLRPRYRRIRAGFDGTGCAIPYEFGTAAERTRLPQPDARRRI